MVEVCLELDFIFNYTKFYLHWVELLMNIDSEIKNRKLSIQSDLEYRTLI